MDIWNVVITILGSAGGAAVIIIAAAKYFSKILADQYIERVKTDFEIEKATKIRYSSTQFEEYSKLWSALYDLKLEGEKLWKSATSETLAPFSQQLRKTQTQIERASLFIEDKHYSQLKKILGTFSNYEIGKGRLINFRRQEYYEQGQIDQMISDNGHEKEEYENLILEIRKDLKKQLKG